MKAFQIGGVALTQDDTIFRGRFFTNTGFASGNFVYLQNNHALQYLQRGDTGEHSWLTAPSGTAGNAITFTQAMTLTSGGNLLVGATSNAASTPRMYVTGARAAVFLSTQTGVGGITVTNTSANSDEPSLVASNTNTGASGVTSLYSSLGSGGSAANTNCFHLKAVTQGTASYYLYGNGTTSFSSDLRLKKNVETTRDGYLEDLCKLRVVKYQWASNEDTSPKELGLIAQEVEQVFPGLVQNSGDTIGEVENAKALKASVLPFMLLKALQEQQAIIESLKARLDAANL
jgi:hypothetical protein